MCPEENFGSRLRQKIPAPPAILCKKRNPARLKQRASAIVGRMSSPELGALNNQRLSSQQCSLKQDSSNNQDFFKLCEDFSLQ